VEYVVNPGPKAWIGKINAGATPLSQSPDQHRRVRAVLGSEGTHIMKVPGTPRAALRHRGVPLCAFRATRQPDKFGQPGDITSLANPLPRASAGGGTRPFRAQVNHTNHNFFGLRRLDLNGHASRLARRGQPRR
jgi:hypothetical protein